MSGWSQAVISLPNIWSEFCKYACRSRADADFAGLLSGGMSVRAAVRLGSENGSPANRRERMNRTGPGIRFPVCPKGPFYGNFGSVGASCSE